MSFLDICHFIANFFEGAFICNCIPHLASGLRGEQFPSPFAQPHGVGKSSAVVNFLWGTLNLMIAMLLISFFPVQVGLNVEGAFFMVGFILLGIHLARHFERVNGNEINGK